MLQIQPVYKSHTEYEALAQRQGLFFEVLELSFDPVSDAAEAYYRDHPRVQAIHGAFMDVNPGSGDSLIRGVTDERYVRSCEQALACAAKSVVFHSTCFPFLRGNYLDMWADRSAAYYTALAEKYSGLQIYIENSPDIDPYPIHALMQRISAPNVHVCLDIGHIHYSGTPVEKWFDVLGSRTTYLHLSDNMGVYDDHLPLGEGTVDWQRVSALCAYLPADTPITLEVGDLNGIKKSLRFLKEHDLFGGVVK